MKNERGEVRPLQSSEAAGEQTESRRGRSLGLRGGVGGAKGWGRGEHGRATHVPDTEPGKRVQGLERVREPAKRQVAAAADDHYSGIRAARGAFSVR